MQVESIAEWTFKVLFWIRPLVKNEYQNFCISYSSTKTYVLVAQNNHLNETVLLSKTDGVRKYLQFYAC